MNKLRPLVLPGRRKDSSPETAHVEMLMTFAMKEMLLEAESALEVYEEARARQNAFWEPVTSGTRDLESLFSHEFTMLQARASMAIRAFVASLDRVGRAIDQAAEVSPGPFTGARQRFRSSLPQLREIRNSLEHIEERLLLLGPGRKQIAVIDPVHQSVAGTELTTLLGDGSYGKIDISFKTLEVADRVVRDAFAEMI